jgi:hypothetical protein
VKSTKKLEFDAEPFPEHTKRVRVFGQVQRSRIVHVQLIWDPKLKVGYEGLVTPKELYGF